MASLPIFLLIGVDSFLLGFWLATRRARKILENHLDQRTSQVIRSSHQPGTAGLDRKVVNDD